MIFFKSRVQLAVMFEHWAAENGTSTSNKTFVAWLALKGLLNEDKVMELLKENKK